MEPLTPWPEPPINPVITKQGTMVLWNGIPQIYYHYNAQMCRMEGDKRRGQRHRDMFLYHWLMHRYDLLNRISKQRDKERELLRLLEK